MSAMPNVGPLEILIVMVLFGAPVAIAVALAIGHRRERSPHAPHRHAPPPPAEPGGPERP
jgi:hypothetical protein